MKRSLPVAVLLGLLAVTVGGVVVWSACSKTSSARPNVLVIVLDTLRADHLGVDGYERATSPNVDRFARENLHFPRAFAAAPWTPPSIATLLSGLYPTSHGMMPPDKLPGEGDLSKRLDRNVLTLAEILADSGYRTAALSANPWITPEFGYAQGFETFDVRVDARAEKITELGLARIEELRASGDPFLFYLHYLDPHEPYSPPDDHRIFAGQPLRGSYSPQMVENLDRYDGEIHYLDASLGRLFAELRAKGIYDDLVIVLLGDHGEQFEEHGHLGHGWQLFNEELRVPLVVKPGRTTQGRTIESVVSIVDVLPTILALTGQEAPAAMQGVNLLDERALAARRGVFAEIARRFSFRACVNAAGKKLIVELPWEDQGGDPQAPARRLVGVFEAASRDEPAIEDTNLQRELEAELQKMLDLVTRAKIAPSSDKVLPIDETIQRLRALGYAK
ncbi:MAG: sulfatase [Planctomycetota bacterium]